MDEVAHTVWPRYALTDSMKAAAITARAGLTLRAGQDGFLTWKKANLGTETPK